MPIAMRARRVVWWFQSGVERLRSSSRRVWWTSFLLATLLSGLGVLANPPFAGPDEPAHVIRAVALDHGQLTGKEPNPPLSRVFKPVGASTLVVRAPAIYEPVSGPPCF